MSDPLASFRKGQATVGAASQTGKKPYEAFDKRGRPAPCLEIRTVLQSSQAPQSRYLMDVVFSADFDSSFCLLYSFMAVEVQGRNLKEVRRAIQSGQCEFIQEYHENDFVEPSPGEPVVTSVTFIAGDRLDDILSKYKEGKNRN